jgi:hypothetical protein
MRPVRAIIVITTESVIAAFISSVHHNSPLISTLTVYRVHVNRAIPSITRNFDTGAPRFPPVNDAATGKSKSESHQRNRKSGFYCTSRERFVEYDHQSTLLAHDIINTVARSSGQSARLSYCSGLCVGTTGDRQ